MLGRKRGAMLLDVFKSEIKPRIPQAEFWAVCEEPVDGDGIRWFGRAPLEQLADLFRRAWVFCLPSSYEGFGVPYIEAMASGTPVVASPNVGAIEVTRGGEDGLIASDDELANVLIRALIDADLRRQLRDAGLRRARDFRWDVVCSQYESIYADSASGSGRREAMPS
jgi:glycosyltransferase involved in cell wall biosynthesis